MGKYTLCVYKNAKDGRAIDLPNMKKLENIDDFTTNFDSEGALKVNLIEKGYMTPSELRCKLHLCTTDSKGNVIKGPVAYKNILKYMDEHYLFEKYRVTIEDPKFIGKFIRKFSHLSEATLLDKERRETILATYKDKNQTGLRNIVQNFFALAEYKNYITKVKPEERNDYIRTKAGYAVTNIVNSKAIKKIVNKALTPEGYINIKNILENDEELLFMLKKDFEKGELSNRAYKKISELCGKEKAYRVLHEFTSNTIQVSTNYEIIYNQYRKFAMFLDTYLKEQEKKNNKEEDYEQTSLYDIAEEKEKVEMPEDYLVTPEDYDEPAFPPNTPENDMYLEYVKALNEGKDASKIMEDLESGNYHIR